MKKHVNIPIFIPHLGCPNQCVFCNQRSITGVDEFRTEDVRREIEAALATIPDGTEIEIAFFGGSFTGIDRDLMVELLTVAHEYIVKGIVSSIRCSTRPDYITPDILDILKRYGVKTIELGLQSYDDGVLSMCKRGHSSVDEKYACDLIVKSGFDLIGQMMIGLPGSDIDKELATARFIIESGAVGARIYPTVVFKDTELACMAGANIYEPITLEDAVRRSAMVYGLFIENNIKVIRVGLCASDNLSDENKYYAGPNHPALGEMVEGEYYFAKICEAFDQAEAKAFTSPIVFVKKGSISKAVGHKKINKERLACKYKLADITFREDSSISGYEVKLEEGKR